VSVRARERERGHDAGTGECAAAEGNGAPATGQKQWTRRRPGWISGPVDIRIQCLCIDSAHPSKSADFWEAALGWRRTHDSETEVVLEPPEGSPEDGVAPDILFLKVAEPKTAKNRLHLDLRPKDQAAEVARLEALGARRTDVGQRDVSWVVLTDPDGNEFCVLKPLSAG
jgi:catechol 2,3-dioxygenase-like lactoylglutathione lyase family enzyme